MVFKKLVRGVIRLFHRVETWSIEEEKPVYETKEAEKPEGIDQIHSVWDYLKFKENTQAFHLANVLGFDEWADMGEIRRRIKELFGAEYRNERSLYPYLKTLTDIGLIESNSVGGRMQWRKHDLLVKVEEKTREKKVAVIQRQKRAEREKEE
jgi:hypothetical protein